MDNNTLEMTCLDAAHVMYLMAAERAKEAAKKEAAAKAALDVACGMWAVKVAYADAAWDVWVPKEGGEEVAKEVAKEAAKKEAAAKVATREANAAKAAWEAAKEEAEVAAKEARMLCMNILKLPNRFERELSNG